MKIIKSVAAVLLIMALLVSEGALMGLFSIDEALSEESIEQSMADSDIIAQLVEDALAETTVNMGGRYGEIIQEVMQTDAMTGFFTEYLTSAVNTEIYGKPYEEVAYDELTTAFLAGIDEVNASGAYQITEMESDMMYQYMKEEAPDLTARLNSQVGNYEALSGQLTEEAVSPAENLQMLMGSGVRFITILVCVFLGGGLVALCRKSRLGFLWWSLVTGAVAAVYGWLANTGGKALVPIVPSSASEEMVLGMMTDGFEAVTKWGFLAAAVLLAIFAGMKLFDRRRNK